ncbi:non-ribosomal peptide synthetase [Streptomyces sp. NRRL F-5727]|uniref:non-ribosomal peptide synthetase n=1 Tax=Streptomyces sp. NRRL F-5727 TaxID=1463871 RepID=UPI000690C681|nr:non-ribosomal peptide synthetase [Streptomyces sp. NRRL F-5727]
MTTDSPLLHERFAAVAAAHPDAPSVTCGDRTLTYAELRRRVERRAAWLRSLGAGPEQIIGVHLDRGIEAVVSMLAVVEAGAAYLPLPLDYPEARLTLMAGQCAVRLVLSSADGPDTPFTDPVRTLLVEDEPAEPAGPSAASAAPRPHPDNLAYVVYTSGSTGTPKGVGVTHRGAVNLVDPRQTYVDFGPGESFLQLAPLAFDVAAFEIWGALASGGRLVVAAPSYQAIEELPDLLVRERITTALITTTLFHVLWDARPDAFDSVRRLIVGGSVMSMDRARAFTARHAARGADHLLINGYGPSEATTCVSAHAMGPIPDDETNPPLGTPLDGVTLRLLDEHGREVGPGGEGQIHTGGVAVTRGYLGRPGATSLRFLPDPYADEPGARMYATGDRGRMRADGLIEYLGRFDDQVKVRGHRVELGEVEAAVNSHPDVRDACVVLVREDSGAERLVAHLVPAGPLGEPGRRASLAAHLARLLPEYMRPGGYVEHDVLPRGLHGKVDREALVRLGHAPATPDGEHNEPASWVESAMAEVWSELLGVAQVSRDDDFFQLGGDSLLAVKAVMRAEDHGLPLTLTLVLTRPVLGDLCAELEKRLADGPGPGRGPHTG